MDEPVFRFASDATPASPAIAERYGLRLSPQWAEWFDSQAAHITCDGEFTDPVHPDVLLQPAPEVIWPGLMPPDLLPVVGNSIGDWLCARVGPDNSITEVVHWYHGGGDCLPYGETLAEALVYDSLAGRLPGRARGLAVPAEPPPRHSRNLLRDRPATRWALSHLPAETAEVFQSDFPGYMIGSRLLKCCVAEVAVRCDMVLAALDNEVRRRMNPQTAAMLEARWDRDVVQWMFDPSRMPPEVVERLAEHWQLPADRWQHQDWDTAQRHCSHVAALRGDLAWVHDILGWAAQRRGADEEAADHYRRGAAASIFTDQAVRFRTHFDSDRICKFSVARLVELGKVDRLDPLYVDMLTVTPSPADRQAAGWRDRVSDYWLDQADHVGVDSYDNYSAPRYEMIYRAGWDVGCDSIKRYQSLLSELAEAADAAGQTARAALARTHLECLRGRYCIG